MSTTKPSLEGLRIERKPEPTRQSNPVAIVVAVVLILLLGGGAVWWHFRTATILVSAVPAREAASTGADRTVLNASGYVTARRQAVVSSKVTGKVTDILIEEGMKVKEGQVLAKLDDTNVRTSLEVAQAQLEESRAAIDETKAQLKAANAEYDRQMALASAQISSPSDLDTAESNAKALRAHLAMLDRDVVVQEKQVASWQQQMDDMIIRSPFDGVVTTKDAQPGEMISPVSAGGGFTRTGIGTVVDMKSLEIEIDVNESYINRVVVGQPVEATLDAYPDWKIPCKVIAIIPTADREKSTVKVRISFDALDPRILPNMSAKVAFRESGAEAKVREVIVPKSALKNQDGRDVVFILQNAHAERRAVTVASSREDEVSLSAGVSGGEKVIVNPPDGLTDGAAVKEKDL